MPTPTPPKKLLDQVRDLIRLKHYSLHTEEAYTDWIKRFILFHGKRHPQEMGSPEMECVRLRVKDLEFGQHQKPGRFRRP